VGWGTIIPRRKAAQAHAREPRKRIATLIKELQPQASNRKIARTLGVSHTQVGRDGTNVPRADKGGRRSKGSGTEAGTNVPAEFSGERAAKLVMGRETASADRLAKVAADEARVPVSASTCADTPPKASLRPAQASSLL
jgi:hypothetical protein